MKRPAQHRFDALAPLRSGLFSMAGLLLVLLEPTAVTLIEWSEVAALYLASAAVALAFMQHRLRADPSA